MKYVIEIDLDNDSAMDDMPQIMEGLANRFRLWGVAGSIIRDSNGNRIGEGLLVKEEDDD